MSRLTDRQFDFSSEGVFFYPFPAGNRTFHPIAEKAADNYRILRSKGIAIRKTTGVIIATFCVETGLSLVHNDGDFSFMTSTLLLKIF